MCWFYRLPTSNHYIKVSNLKFKIFTFVSLSPNSIWLLLPSINLIVKLNKLFKDIVVNRKQMCFLLFISFCSSVVLIHIDWPLIPSFQIFILLWSIITSSPEILPFIKDFFTSFNSQQVINICSVLFFTNVGNKKPSSVNLHLALFMLFNMFMILKSSSSIFTGFSPPSTSKLYCTRTMNFLLALAFVFFSVFLSLTRKSYKFCCLWAVVFAYLYLSVENLKNLLECPFLHKNLKILPDRLF